MNPSLEAQILLKQIERFVSVKGRETVFKRLGAALERVYAKGREDGAAYVRSLPPPVTFTARFGPIWQVAFKEIGHGRSETQG
jgi:hypothetical protein